MIGQFVAKAMLDSRIIDLSFNKVFLKLILGEEVVLTVDNLRVSVYPMLPLTSILIVSSVWILNLRRRSSNCGT